jgi:hypothetical protein
MISSSTQIRQPKWHLECKFQESCSSGKWENGRKGNMTQIFNNCGQE